MSTEAPNAPATIEEVAAAAGVSRSTVSRVVNGSTSVSPSALESVQRAIADLNYVPNRAARSLASRQTQAIALVVPEDTTRFFGDPFFAAIVSGINSRLTQVGLRPQPLHRQRRSRRQDDELSAQRGRRWGDHRLAPHERHVHRPDRGIRPRRLRRPPGSRARARLLRRRRQRARRTGCHGLPDLAGTPSHRHDHRTPVDAGGRRPARGLSPGDRRGGTRGGPDRRRRTSRRTAVPRR